MSYTPLRDHRPRTPAWSPRPSPGYSTGGSGSYGGVSWHTTRGRLYSTTRIGGTAANSNRRFRLVADNTGRRIAQSVRRAFPAGKWARRLAPVAQRVSEGYAVYEAVSEALATLDEVIGNQAWRQTTAEVNPGFTQTADRTHSQWAAAPKYQRGPGMGRYYSAGTMVGVPENNVLAITTARGEQPTGNWAYPPLPRFVPNNWYFRFAYDAYGVVQPPGVQRYYGRWKEYRNVTGTPAEPYSPATSPLPLGVPLPAGLPEGYPLAEPQAVPRARPLPRPKPMEEVAIEFPPGPKPIPRVYPARARPPGKKGKETKAYGNSAVASFVFWLYEATDDWKDWAEILLSAIPDAPQDGPFWERLKWLIENPHKIATADFEQIARELIGWAIDEKIGAFVGDVNKRANRGISFSSTTVDMRTNVSLHYGSGGSAGSAVTSFLAGL